MNKYTKIYGAVLILLVMLTNISYSVTYSFCGMSSSTNCSCNMDSKENQSSFKNVSCCKEEVKNISNNADFTKLQEQLNKSDYANTDYILTETTIISNYITQKENVVFQVPKRDIPIQFSRLII